MAAPGLEIMDGSLNTLQLNKDLFIHDLIFNWSFMFQKSAYRETIPLSWCRYMGHVYVSSSSSSANPNSSSTDSKT
jgi:hypothetical protein